MANDPTLPLTGTGDATVKVEALQQASGAQRQVMAAAEINDAPFRAALIALAQALPLSVDPGTGRLRMVLESAGTPAAGLATVNANGVPVTFASNTATITLSNISTTANGGNKPDTMIFDLMQAAWAQSIGNFIGR